MMKNICFRISHYLVINMFCGLTCTHNGGEEDGTNYQLTREFSQSYFTLVEHKRHREDVSVQKSEVYKTLILMLLGEIKFVIRSDCIFVNL